MTSVLGGRRRRCGRQICTERGWCWDGCGSGGRSMNENGSSGGKGEGRSAECVIFGV